MQTDYRSLPDSLEAEELAGYFREFLEVYADAPKTLAVLGELYELAYRQWDTYEKLDPSIEESLEQYLMQAMDFRSFEITDKILSIVENLSLKQSFEYIISQKDENILPAVRELIEEAEEEYGDSIENPYGGFEDDDEEDDW